VSTPVEARTSHREWRVTVHDTAIVIAIYALTRLISAAFVMVAGAHQQGTAQFINPDPWKYYVWKALPPSPGYLDVLTNWDGQWYLRIVTMGYLPASDDPLGFAERAWSFPPVFPLTTAGVSGALGLSPALAATIVSSIAGAVAMVLMFHLVTPRIDRLGAFILVAVTGCYITAPLYQAAYSESMALCFLLWTLLDLRNRRYARMFLPLFLLAFTRLITPPLAVVAIAHYLARRRSADGPSTPQTWLLAAFGVACVAGGGAWPYIASQLSGSASVDRSRVMLSSDDLGTFDILWSIEPWTVILPVALSLGLLRLAISDRERLGPELCAWSAAYPIFVLAVTPPTPGFFRYLMLAFSLGIGAVGFPHTPLRKRLATAVVVCAVMLVLQYFWVSYSLVINPGPGRPWLNP
jgi:hypothetical protein